MNVVIFIAYTGSQFTNSPGTFFRSAAQISLHKMYTFVYRTFIKFILFCRGQAPDVSELVNTMLDNAIVLLKENEHPIVHSDRGCHYRWSGWIQRMDEAGLTRSMSKKGCSPDNSACEGFFGRMKNEMFYGEKWDKISVEEFISIINQYMQWYRDKRIKLSLGGLSPMEYRRSLGIA